MNSETFFGRTVLLGLLEFSDWQLVQVLVEACHFVSSQAAHRHPQLVPVRDKMLCPFQWAPSDRSRDGVLGTIASFSWCLDLSCVSSRLKSLLWLHGRLIELLCNLSDFMTQCGIDTAMVT